MSQRVVFALGGNAILQPKQVASYENQYHNVVQSAEIIMKIYQLGYQIVVTHGNGPQVGNILRQNEETKAIVPPMPLDVCNAQSQGFIGYMISRALKNQFDKVRPNMVTLLTEVEVDPNDEAFQQPNKPIGLFYTEQQAQQLTAEKGWHLKEDAGRGYRRVVPSPQPKTIHGVNVIKTLLDNEAIVVAGGGGGIPVIATEHGYEGIEAVIDKDRTAKKLAEEIDADVLMILTDISNVYIHYGTERQQKLETITIDEARQYAKEGHFAAGSMGPKVEAAIDFASRGKTAIICSLLEADKALQGQAGTRIVG